MPLQQVLVDGFVGCDSDGQVELATSHNPNLKQQDAFLFTLGPLTTSYSVKYAMLHDISSRDSSSVHLVREICDGILDVGGVNAEEFTVVPMHGNDELCIESLLSSAVDKKCGLLAVVNGEYGNRIKAIAKSLRLPLVMCESQKNHELPYERIEELLKSDAQNVSHVAVVHCDTSGVINDIHRVGLIAKMYNKAYIVESMLGFGSTTIDFTIVDYLVSSSYRCMEGIPGFGFIIARRSELTKCKDNAFSIAMDLYEERVCLDSYGHFRFTPPTHALLAFKQALLEFEHEGGVLSRSNRYKQNQRVIHAGMTKLGFRLFLPIELQGHIVSTYLCPTDSNWNFETFYNKLIGYGFVICPGEAEDGKISCFKIGHIGRIFPLDSNCLVTIIDNICREMQTACYAST